MVEFRFSQYELEQSTQYGQIGVSLLRGLAMPAYGFDFDIVIRYTLTLRLPNQGSRYQQSFTDRFVKSVG